MLIMAGDFNIRNNIWDPSYPFHLIYSDFLFDIADSLNLKLSISIQQISTQYSDNTNNANSVINLFFLHPNFIKINNDSINEIQYPSDYAPLTVNIVLIEKFI